MGSWSGSLSLCTWWIWQ